MVFIDNLIDNLKNARDIDTDTEEADDCIDTVIGEIESLQGEVDDLFDEIADTLAEMEDEEKVVTSTDTASYNEGYIDALVNMKEKLIRLFDYEA